MSKKSKKKHAKKVDKKKEKKLKKRGKKHKKGELSPARREVHKLLRKFGASADKAVMDYLASLPADQPLDLEIQLKDMTDYAAGIPGTPLELTIRGTIRRH
jgi:hypothetical protein